MGERESARGCEGKFKIGSKRVWISHSLGPSVPLGIWELVQAGFYTMWPHTAFKLIQFAVMLCTLSNPKYIQHSPSSQAL